MTVLTVPEVGDCSLSVCPAPSLTSSHRAPCSPDDLISHTEHTLASPLPAPPVATATPGPGHQLGTRQVGTCLLLVLQFLTSKVDTSCWCPQTLSLACAHTSAVGPGDACPLSLGSFALDSSLRHMTHFCSHQDDTARSAFSWMRHNGTEPGHEPRQPESYFRRCRESVPPNIQAIGWIFAHFGVLL